MHNAFQMFYSLFKLLDVDLKFTNFQARGLELEGVISVDSAQFLLMLAYNNNADDDDNNDNDKCLIIISGNEATHVTIIMMIMKKRM